MNIEVELPYESMTKDELEAIVDNLEYQIPRRREKIKRYTMDKTCLRYEKLQKECERMIKVNETQNIILYNVKRILFTKFGINGSSQEERVESEINSMSLEGLEKYIKRMERSIEIDSEKIQRFQDSEDIDTGLTDWNELVADLDTQRSTLEIAKKRFSELNDTIPTEKVLEVEESMDEEVNNMSKEEIDNMTKDELVNFIVKMDRSIKINREKVKHLRDDDPKNSVIESNRLESNRLIMKIECDRDNFYMAKARLSKIDNEVYVIPIEEMSKEDIKINIKRLETLIDDTQKSYDDYDIAYKNSLKIIDPEITGKDPRDEKLRKHRDTLADQLTEYRNRLINFESALCKMKSEPEEDVVGKKTVMVLYTKEYPFQIFKYVSDIEEDKSVASFMSIDSVMVSSCHKLEENFDIPMPVCQLLTEIPSIEFIANSEKFVAFDGGVVSQEELEAFLADNGWEFLKLRLEKREKAQQIHLDNVCKYTKLLEKDRVEIAAIRDEMKRAAPRLYGRTLEEMVSERNERLIPYGDFTVNCDNFYTIKEPTKADLIKIMIYCNETFLLMDQTEELCKAALDKIDIRMLVYIHNQTEELIKYAIDIDMGALRYVREQTKDICTYALDSYPDHSDVIIGFIRNPEILFEEDLS